MRTPIVLCALFSLAFGSALAQTLVSKEAWRVDPAAQRELDGARKRILEDELASEAKQFTDAHAELRDAGARQMSSEKVEDVSERVNRHRRNMAELAREIARSEGDVAGNGARSKPVADRAADNWLIPVAPAEKAPLARVREPLQGNAPKAEYPEWVVPANGAGKRR